MSTTIAQLVLEATALLREAGVPEARLDAGALLAHVLHRDRTFIIGHAEDVVDGDVIEVFQKLVGRRAQGEPLQYITGRQEFFGLDFEVSDAVLIPRPETELLVQTALELLGPIENPLICDIGTGSGCIAITLLHHLPQARVIAVDVSKQALELAERNARRLGVSDRVTFALSDCFSAIDRDQLFDMVVSNPPYVAADALDGLQREVRDFEPKAALTPGADGLAIIRRLIEETPYVLKRHGYLLLEIGFDQRDRVAGMIDPQEWNLLDVHKDLQGIPRTVVLQKL